MPAKSTFPLQRLRHWAVAQRFAAGLLVGTANILMALPPRWVLKAADAVGTIVAIFNLRGRRVAMENLETVFGDTLSKRERKRIFKATQCSVARSMFLLMHLHPLTPERYRKWVDSDPDLARQPYVRDLFTKGGVVVSGHVGNWEFLLGLRVLHQDLPPTAFLAEAIPHEIVDQLLVRLRSHGDLIHVPRRGGARVVTRTVAQGGIAALLVDRNVRRQNGGVFVPFLGLEARTTPLAARIALRYDRPIHAFFCLPTENGRFRIELSRDLSGGVEALEPKAAQVELMRRVNAELERHIRADPTLWQWSLKRFKSRPHAERGPYPSYSVHDPDG